MADEKNLLDEHYILPPDAPAERALSGIRALVLAPIVMAVIGKMRNSDTSQQNSGSGFGDLANILMGSVQSAAQSGGFGDLIGKVLGGVLGGQQAPTQDSAQVGGGGLLGNILGNIFKK